jgi:inositol polyphosphate 5-phosphatase INPP5B/F
LIIKQGNKFEIKLTILIDSQTASLLNKSIDGEISENLIIHVEDGNDYQIQIGGNFLKSCYGNSLSQLICYYEPVRKLSIEKVELVLSGKLQKLKIPKELWRIIDYLYKHGLKNVIYN